MLVQRIGSLAILMSALAACASDGGMQMANAVPEVRVSNRTPLPALTAEQSAKLDERFPKAAREVLQRAERIEIFSLEFDPTCLWPKIEKASDDKFQGCRIENRAVISDPEMKKEFLAALFYGIGNGNDQYACSSPRHGVRAEYGGHYVDLVISFECRNFRGVSESGDFGGQISESALKAFTGAGITD